MEQCYFLIINYLQKKLGFLHFKKIVGVNLFFAFKRQQILTIVMNVALNSALVKSLINTSATSYFCIFHIVMVVMVLSNKRLEKI